MTYNDHVSRCHSGFLSYLAFASDGSIIIGAWSEMLSRAIIKYSFLCVRMIHKNASHADFRLDSMVNC